MSTKTLVERPWQPWERNFSGGRIGVQEQQGTDENWMILHVESGGVKTTTSLRLHEAWDLARLISPQFEAERHRAAARIAQLEAERDKLIELGGAINASADDINGEIDAKRRMDEESPCTDCGDTGITYQTERRCACQVDRPEPAAVTKDTHRCGHIAPGEVCQEPNMHCGWPACAVPKVDPNKASLRTQPV